MTEKADLPYREIPSYPEEYSPGNVAARVVDGLGYRYYWATEDLVQEDLDFKPSEDSRNARATLDHLYSLSKTIVNATNQAANVRPTKKEELSFEDMRRKTLENFQSASDILKENGKKEQLEEYAIVFQRGEDKVEFPFWNLLNGPIADAIYHVGQIVTYRRASGNPISPMVNVFTGKTRE